MIQLVGIGEMFAIPRHQKITFVQRCERQMDGIAKSSLRHQPMLKITPTISSTASCASNTGMLFTKSNADSRFGLGLLASSAKTA